MKNIFLILLIGVLLSACGNRNEDVIKTSDIHNPASAKEDKTKKETANLPVITFEKNIHDFGKVMQGERLSYTFKFKNTGKSNLIIDRAESSCGCTTTTPPKTPIRPGESGQIKVIFDSKTKKGQETNVIVVTANTYPVHTVLKITAEVITP